MSGGIKMQEVNFKVLEIKKGDKEGIVGVDVQFDNSEKVYSYWRGIGISDGRTYALISGCKVFFDEELKVTSIEREYDVKGVYRGKTSAEKGEWRTPESKPRRRRGRPRKVSDEVKREVEQLPKTEAQTEEVKEELPEVTEVKEEKKEPELPKGPVRHSEYETIMTCLEESVPVYLHGPAGSGKNHTVEQICKEKGWEFYFTNSVQQEYKVTGFVDAGGVFHDTEFYKACTSENECIFFLDEIDASIPEVLVLLNAAIANGYFEFPNGRVKWNKKRLHFVCAGNTVGSGADEMYTGRMVIDQATLDRFMFVPYDYDRNIELKITNGNVELVDFIHGIRDIAKERGIRATFSYRCMLMMKKLEGKIELSKLLKMCVFKGMDEDTLNIFKGAYKYKSGKYYEALRNI